MTENEKTKLHDVILLACRLLHRMDKQMDMLEHGQEMNHLKTFTEDLAQIICNLENIENK